jgi:hypothetical protein
MTATRASLAELLESPEPAPTTDLPTYEPVSLDELVAESHRWVHEERIDDPTSDWVERDLTRLGISQEIIFALLGERDYTAGAHVHMGIRIGEFLARRRQDGSE